ncbi:MAG: bifunctional oligoribonuclease/PAP phosphatase NrnA [Natronomonas sp.]
MQLESVDGVAAFETLRQTAAEDPTVTVSAVLVAAIALVGLVVLFRWYRRSEADRFVAAIEECDSVSILMHPDPDPDSMAAAMGVGALVEQAGTRATLQYPGKIRRSENRAFETVLDCSFDRIESADELAADTVVLVDHNSPRGFDGAEDLDPYAVVDHHPGNGDGEMFTDIRPDRGACAGIVGEYLRDRGWTAEQDGGPTIPPELATALLYGIQSDTTAFTRGCTDAEFDVAAFLFPAADSGKLDRIAHPELDTETLEIKSRAIDRRTHDGPFLVSHVGSLSNREALAVAAEELVRLEGVTAAIVTGENDGALHISGRSRDDRVHMGKVLQTALSGIDGASAGGHSRMGGGQTPLPPPTGRGSHPQLTNRLFESMHGSV